MHNVLTRWFTIASSALLLVVAAALVPGVASAQGPSGSYASGISCLNLGNATASISITFYQTNGSSVGPIQNDSVAAGSAWLLFTPNIDELSNFDTGSAVVSSDQPVACSVNTQTTGGVTRVGTSDGLGPAQIGPTVFATQVLNLDSFGSYVAIQNTSDSATDVQATFLNSDGSQAHQETQNVPAFSTHVFYQDDGSLPQGFLGSARFAAVDGQTELAGTVALFHQTDAQLLSYNTFTSGNTTVFLPRVAKNLSGLGYTSGISCQNVGDTSTDITMSITLGGQTGELSRQDVPSGSAYAIYMGDTGNATLDNIDSGFGSAVVTSSASEIACTVNEDVRTSPNQGLVGQGTTYGGVADGNQSNTMFFPQIVALGEPSFRGGFQIANTTNTAATCTYTLSNSIGDEGTYTFENQSLAANGSNSVFAPNLLATQAGAPSTAFNGSATVTCDQPIVGIYNLSIIGESASGDPFAQNNGINQ